MKEYNKTIGMEVLSLTIAKLRQGKCGENMKNYKATIGMEVHVELQDVLLL